MGLILDIVNKVVPRTLDRLEHEGGMLKDILAEELQKEVAYSLCNQTEGDKHNKEFNDSIAKTEEIIK